jgi:prolipoprotein diacylglyceryltransferase
MPWYSLFYAAAIASSAAILIVEGRRRFGSDRWTFAVTLWAIGGIVGAALPHMLFGELFGARTAVGAVAGATLALMIASAALQLDLRASLDASAVAIPIGGALARLGCFIADCCQGLPTQLAIGIVDHDGTRRHACGTHHSEVVPAGAMSVNSQLDEAT